MEKYNIDTTDEVTINKIRNCMKWYKLLHPIHSICLLIYIFGCFFERPAWCIQNDPEKVPGLETIGYGVDSKWGVNYWFCRSDSGQEVFPTWPLPFMPPIIGNVMFILC
jgi:hypothetical protein